MQICRFNDLGCILFVLETLTSCWRAETLAGLSVHCLWAPLHSLSGVVSSGLEALPALVLLSDLLTLSGDNDRPGRGDILCWGVQSEQRSRADSAKKQSCCGSAERAWSPWWSGSHATGSWSFKFWKWWSQSCCRYFNPIIDWTQSFDDWNRLSGFILSSVRWFFY